MGKEIRSGSKGDYIYRETDEYDNEIISIMFEMKNEMDTTATKHKNEDFFKELAQVKNQDIDISNFEESLLQFKDDFSRNYDIAHKHFDKAIDEIDKTINHLEKVKKELQGSDNQLRIANNKVDEVNIKRLTKNNPTMRAKFEELKE